MDIRRLPADELEKLRKKTEKDIQNLQELEIKDNEEFYAISHKKGGK